MGVDVEVDGRVAVSRIKTVVVLVQENRSFDHMLGWMKSRNPEIDGVSSPDQFSNPVDTSDPQSKRIYFGKESVHVDPDPGHAFQDIYEQVFGEPWSGEKKPILRPSMQGFVQNAKRKQVLLQAQKHSSGNLEKTVMNGFDPDLVPVYRELVTQFGVCDRWFSSVPAYTQPNRLFVHSATSHGLCTETNKVFLDGVPQKTVFDSMHEAGYSFGIYYQHVPSVLLYTKLRQPKYAANFHAYDSKFKDHCREGKLPNYTVIEPRFFDLLALPGNDDHPSHDVARGQELVKEVYEALRSSPHWEQTLFVLVYDEHGGFFDHVPTPVQGVPTPDGIMGPNPYCFDFDRLGVRVPAIFISPWIQPGTVLHEPSGPYPTSQYEHSSVPATVKKIFNLPDFLNKRDAWAGTFDVVLNRDTPRSDCPLTLPEPVKLRDSSAKEDEKLSSFQTELVQLAACLKHQNDTNFTHNLELLDSMTVSEAAKYVHEAFRIFSDNIRDDKADEGLNDQFDHNYNHRHWTTTSLIRPLTRPRN